MASRLRDQRGYPGVGGTGRPDQRLGRLERENAALRERVDQLQHANQQLQARIRKLTGQVKQRRPPTPPCALPDPPTVMNVSAECS